MFLQLNPRVLIIVLSTSCAKAKLRPFPMESKNDLRLNQCFRFIFKVLFFGESIALGQCARNTMVKGKYLNVSYEAFESNKNRSKLVSKSWI